PKTRASQLPMHLLMGKIRPWVWSSCPNPSVQNTGLPDVPAKPVYRDSGGIRGFQRFPLPLRIHYGQRTNLYRPGLVALFVRKISVIPAGDLHIAQRL